jgi:hypothetical protein
MRTLLRSWFPFAVLSTVLCAFGYAALQQEIRMSANELPARLAEDAVAVLESGQGTGSMLPTRVDLARSRSPFVIIVNENGKKMESSAVLHGKTPVPPVGVFDEARMAGENSVTWQPEPGVRIAAVVRKTDAPHPLFVLAGQSLQGPEERVQRIGMIALAGWLLSLGITFLALLAAQPRKTGQNAS